MRRTLTLCLILAASAAVAHTGVKNPEVLARMNAMKSIADATKVLAQMAKGVEPFDRDKMLGAASQIELGAPKAVDLFRTRADDPKSEALPVIWDEWGRFEAMSDDMARAAASFEAVETTKDLQKAVANLGATCAACHKAYRE